VARVPGAFEIPQAAQRIAETGEYAAVVCLGCLIKGATPHFDYIASAVSHALERSSTATGVPMAFGVLTTNSAEEAIERAGRARQQGPRSRAAALEMATLFQALQIPAGGLT
jgi:6,7-dimethyl-8-ribityllumazine synthase